MYKECEVLKYLTQHAGRVLIRERLLHEVWERDFFLTGPRPSMYTCVNCGHNLGSNTKC